MFVCEICKKEYDTVAERSECEKACLVKAEEEKKRAEREAIENVKKARECEIKEGIIGLRDKINSFFNDYGTYPADAISVCHFSFADSTPTSLWQIFDKIFF